MLHYPPKEIKIPKKWTVIQDHERRSMSMFSKEKNQKKRVFKGVKENLKYLLNVRERKIKIKML